MERLSGDMGALDKIQDLIYRLESGDKEFIALFEKSFQEFEEEYFKFRWNSNA